MRQNIEAVIFDFGNVLVKWDPLAIFERYFPTEDAAREFMDEVGFFDWNAQLDAGRPFQEGVAELTARFPHHRQAIEGYHAHWEASITEVFHGTIKILHKLKRLGFRLFVLSNFSLETFPKMQERYKFLELFDEIFLSAQFKTVKPGVEIYQIALERIRLPAAACIFIDDSEPNILTANKLGFRTIAFRSPALLDQELGKLLGTTYQTEKASELP